MFNQKIADFVSDRPVVILVPKNETYGVRVFCRALENEIIQSGVDACVADYTFWSAVKLIWKKPSTIFVLNLHYLPLSVFLKKRSVAMLHGFPNRADYSLARYWFTVWAIWFGCRFSGFTIANSGLTKEINEKFFSNSVDLVWNPKSTAGHLDVSEKNTQNAIKPTLVFAGRISKAKGFEKLVAHIEAFGSEYSMITIIGPDPGNLTAMLDRFTNVTIMGSIPQNELLLTLKQHDIFVSLNFLEPYGLVYQEAEDAGCVVVLPTHAGFAETAKLEKTVKILSSTMDDIDIAMQRARNMVIQNAGFDKDNG